ncbi:MAG TPA: hypothetical protein VEH29_10280, partial [Acidimicrobiales bacterium]|nr:hypothetical protein [Acidimicrobiales bacterium]
MTFRALALSEVRSPVRQGRLPRLALASAGFSLAVFLSTASPPGATAARPTGVLARHEAVAPSGESVLPLIEWAPSSPHGIPSSVTGPYTPAQVRAEYDLAPVYDARITGKGTTIGIVDVYGSPTIRKDLTSFDALYDIPAPPSFSIVRPAGRVPRFNEDNSQMTGWAGETTLDVEWAHAMAPGASIVLAVTGVDEVEGT